MKLLGNKSKGRVFVVSAPAGTGKTTLVQRLVKEFPEIVASISYTTRLPRQGEANGKDYYFLDEAAFDEKIAAGEFLEFVRLYGTYYGTSRKWLEEQLSLGKHVVLVIDTQGAKLLRAQLPIVSIFIHPPSVSELERRLYSRGTETQSALEERLKVVKEELEAAALYDYEIINDDLEIAYQVLRSVFIAEEHRVREV